MTNISLLHSALNASSLRQQAISNNLSNAETPRYKAKQVVFEEILKHVWGDDDYFMGRSMDVFISKLRKYLKEDPSVQIVNYHGVGFKLES